MTRTHLVPTIRTKVGCLVGTGAQENISRIMQPAILTNFTFITLHQSLLDWTALMFRIKFRMGAKIGKTQARLLCDFAHHKHTVSLRRRSVYSLKFAAVSRPRLAPLFVRLFTIQQLARSVLPRMHLQFSSAFCSNGN